MTDEQINLLQQQVFFSTLVAPGNSIAACCGAKYGWYDLPTGIDLVVEDEPVEPSVMQDGEYPRYNIVTDSYPFGDSFLNVRINRAANFKHEWQDLYEDERSSILIKSTHSTPNTTLYALGFDPIWGFMNRGYITKYHDRTWLGTQVNIDVDEAFAWFKEKVKGDWFFFILNDYQLELFQSFLKRIGWTINTEIKDINNLVHDNDEQYNYLTAYLIKAD